MAACSQHGKAAVTQWCTLCYLLYHGQGAHAHGSVLLQAMGHLCKPARRGPSMNKRQVALCSVRWCCCFVSVYASESFLLVHHLPFPSVCLVRVVMEHVGIARTGAATLAGLLCVLSRVHSTTATGGPGMCTYTAHSLSHSCRHCRRYGTAAFDSACSAETAVSLQERRTIALCAS